MDDGSSNYLIENNVCQTASGNSSYWMQFGGAQTITLRHNTILSTAGAQYGNDHNGKPSGNVTFTNNIFYSEPVQNSGQPPSGVTTIDYNLCPNGGCAGAHSIKGTPTFVGGTNPTTYAGFQLTAGSVGIKAASDGLVIGAVISPGAASPLQAPTNLRTTAFISSPEEIWFDTLASLGQ